MKIAFAVIPNGWSTPFVVITVMPVANEPSALRKSAPLNSCAATLGSRKQREHSDIRADVEHTRAVRQMHAVLQVAALLENLVIQVGRLVPVLLCDHLLVRQLIIAIAVAVAVPSRRCHISHKPLIASLLFAHYHGAVSYASLLP